MASSAGSITSKRDSLAPWPADKIKEYSRTYNTHAKVHVELTRGRCRRRCHGNSTTQQSTPTKYYTAELSACNAIAVAFNHFHLCRLGLQSYIESNKQSTAAMVSRGMQSRSMQSRAVQTRDMPSKAIQSSAYKAIQTRDLRNISIQEEAIHNRAMQSRA